MTKTNHVPVLLEETLAWLRPQKGETWVDGTLGGGGHARAILKAVGDKGRVIGIDFDGHNLGQKSIVASNFLTINGNFKDIKEIIQKVKVSSVSGILVDLGFSSDQLEKTEGLSFKKDEILDLRLDSSLTRTAEMILNQEKKEELERIFREYGEEREAKGIALLIFKRRKKKPWARSGELREAVEKYYEGKQHNPKLNPATKVFMALRIAVNNELDNLENFLPAAVDCLGVGGRLGVISFHSLEDRLVKRFFRQESRGCICGEEAWQCACDHRPTLRILTKKPIQPSQKEENINPRSRSARLRVVQKI